MLYKSRLAQCIASHQDTGRGNTSPEDQERNFPPQSRPITEARLPTQLRIPNFRFSHPNTSMARNKGKGPGATRQAKDRKAAEMAAKSKKRSSEAAEDYDSDDGFVVDEDGEGGPKAKKVKSKHSKAQGSDSKGAGVEIPGDGDVDDDGSEFWEVSGARGFAILAFSRKMD